MAKVLTIYGIGSGHTYVEQYNTVVELCNKTVADIKIVLVNGDSINYVRVYNGVNSTELLPNNWAQGKERVCILVDGPDSSPLKANGYFESQFNLIKPLIDTFKPDIINATGHSRGAIFCLFTINQLASTYKGKCNVFLIDPVNMSSADKDLALHLGPNISEYKRIVMEDDQKTPAFPMAPITSAGGPVIVSTDNIRLPGTHGTATQLTPIVPNGCDLPSESKGISNDRWPIALTTFYSITKEFYKWGTRFNIRGFNGNTSNFDLMECYSQINRRNLIEYDGDYQRIINDAELSMEGQKASNDLLSLGGILARNKKDLNALCLNRYQLSPLFINEQHFTLFKNECPNLKSIIPLCYVSKLFWETHPDVETQERMDFDHDYKNNPQAQVEYKELRSKCPSMSILLIEYLEIE